MNYDLPTSVEIGGESYAVRSDYRAILDICAAMSDVELNTQEKSIVALSIFYPDLEKIPSEGMREALERCFWFINWGGQPENRQQPKLVDWEQDFPYIPLYNLYLLLTSVSSTSVSFDIDRCRTVAGCFGVDALDIPLPGFFHIWHKCRESHAFNG